LSPQLKPARRNFLMRHALCRHPSGEIRVDLIKPGAQATITFDDAATPTTANVGGNAATKVVPAKLTVSSLASLSGPPTAIHIHGPARRSVGAGVLVGVCGASPLTSCSALATGSQTFDISIPLELVNTRSTYINVHTKAFGGGEIRGQISPETTLPLTNPGSSSSSLSITNSANMLQEGVDRTMSFTANASTSMATASFSVTFCKNGTMTFSSINTMGFGSPSNQNNNVTAVHIHGPCPDRNPCDTGVVYTICGGGSCPTGASPTIPGFNVNTAQATDGSLLLGLMTEIQRGEKLYYVNFHTST
jgi:hypothetical protein